MSPLLAIVIVGLGTYACRAVFILAFANRKMPEALQRALQYVAPATLSALLVTLLIDKDGNLVITIAEVAGLAAAAVVAHFTRNHVFTLVVGMGVFLTLKHLL
ncbi:AzlD domain-containing protein [bacterium SCSIO 12696]|nr:AzlD domain-containing protein [bacterium SCSIO 12696]